ncbi:MAG: glycerol-3-phosphate dehydrogenase [Lachnospiraceae bacterium]|nr:glycerol-3-phosphate dehydrogenase [Lachnospiraceae bacterium]
MSTVVIVGSGMMGSALSVPLSENGHKVRLVGSPLDAKIIEHGRKTNEHLAMKRMMPKGVEWYYFEEADKAMEGADLYINGVSSFGLDWFIKEMIPRIPETLPVLSVTKGMVNYPDGSLKSYPEIFEESTDKKISFNAIGGPCTSYELADKDFTEVAFCGRDMEMLRWIKSLFETEYYNVSLSTDVRGVECAVAMKNAYALGVSLAIGMSYAREGKEFEHYNSQAALFGQSVVEMIRILELCGGHPSNVRLLSGDLYVTVFGGRTRKIGTLLGTGMDFEEAMAVLEGVTLESIVIATRTAQAIRALIDAGKVRAEEFPLLLHVDELINQGKKVNIPWKAFETELEL